MESALIWIAIGVWGFLIFALPAIVKTIVDGKTKIAEETTAQKRLELEMTQLNHPHESKV